MGRENYGIDAPTVVRNMAVGSLICAGFWAASLFPQAGVLHDLARSFRAPASA